MDRPGISTSDWQRKMRKADDATRGGECPGFIVGIGGAAERVYCDRGRYHERHGALGDGRHQAMLWHGMVIYWR